MPSEPVHAQLQAACEVAVALAREAGALQLRGRLDCGMLVGAKLWDVAAGLVLAREAGVVLGGAGGVPSPELVVAAARGVWPEFTAGAAVQQVTAH